MRKLIFLLYVTTFLVVSMLSVKQFEYTQYQSFNSENSNADVWSIKIESGNPQKSKTENFHILEDISGHLEVNMQRISYEKGINNEDKIVYYVILNKPDSYFEKLKLSTGELLNKRSEPTDFLSTEQTNDENQVGQLELFYSFEPIEVRPMIAVEKIKDIKGIYTLNGEENAVKFKEIAESNGFLVTVSKEDSNGMITEYPYQDMFYITSIVLCLLIALAMFYDVINNFKSIAVRKLLGYSFSEIGTYLFKRYIGIFIGSMTIAFISLILYLYFYNQFRQVVPFLKFWVKSNSPIIIVILTIFLIAVLGTLLINVSQMIKNKKPIKLMLCLNIGVRFILAVFLILGLQQGISTYLSLKVTEETEDKWSTLNDFSYLGIVSADVSRIQDYLKDEKDRKKLQEFYKELESSGAIFISPSAYYINDTSDIYLDTNPWGMDGRKVEINKNYLTINPIIGVDNKPVEIPDPIENDLNVIVPIKYQEYENDIKSTIARDYKGIYNLEDNNPVNVNIIYVNNNQSYFTYSTNFGESEDYGINDAIAVIVNSKYDPRILVNQISMGYGYYTKNSGIETPFSKTQDILSQYQFDNIWQPISIAYSDVEMKLANDRELLQLAIINSILVIFLSIILLFFSSMYYLELNKQTLAVQRIFGYNFFEKHNLVYLFILVFWNFAFILCFFNATETSLLAKITLGIVCVDILLMSIIISVKEHDTTKQLTTEK